MIIVIFTIFKLGVNVVFLLFQWQSKIEGAMITMECQPGGHGGHLGHSMMLDPSGAMLHQQEDHKKKSKYLKKYYP